MSVAPPQQTWCDRCGGVRGKFLEDWRETSAAPLERICQECRTCVVCRTIVKRAAEGRAKATRMIQQGKAVVRDGKAYHFLCEFEGRRKGVLP